MVDPIPKLLFVILPVMDIFFYIFFISLRPSKFLLPLRPVDVLSAICASLAATGAILVIASAPALLVRTFLVLYHVLQAYRLQIIFSPVATNNRQPCHALRNLWWLFIGALVTLALAVLYFLKRY